MHTRRDMLTHSAQVAAMLASIGMLPSLAQAQAQPPASTTPHSRPRPWPI